MLGGVALATAHDVVQESRIARVPRGAEPPTQQLKGLLDAHEFLLNEARPLAPAAAEHGDDGTNDIIVSDLIRTNELQAWFVESTSPASPTEEVARAAIPTCNRFARETRATCSGIKRRSS